MNITPVNSMLLIQPTKPRKMTRAGIIIPDEAKSRLAPMLYAKVLAKGKGELLDCGQRDSVDCEVGDWIVFNPSVAPVFPIEYTGDEIKSDDIPDRALMFFEHVLGVVEFAEGEEPSEMGEEIPMAKPQAQNNKPKLVLARDAGPANGLSLRNANHKQRRN